MSNNSRTWVLIGFIGLIGVGAALILSPLLSPASTQAVPTPLPTALTIDQGMPYLTVPRVNVGDAHTAYESQQAVFVDVRTAGQYAQSHVPGAKSIPLNELESRLNELNKERLIITYCT